MNEIDLDKCVPCEECESLMMRISLPSERPKWECVSCGVIMWMEDEETTWTGKDENLVEFSFKVRSSEQTAREET